MTVTDVRVTGDLQQASIFYTVFGSEEEREATAQALADNKGRIRSAIGKGLGIRLTPSIEFIPDAIPEGAAQIEELLAQACRIVIFRITRVRRVTQAEIGFHFWSFLWWCRIVPAPAITGLIRERGHGKFSGTGPPGAGWAAGPDASSEPAGLLPKRSPATLAVIGGYFLIKSARIGVKLSTRRNCLVVDFTVCGTLLGTAKISPVLRCCTGRSPM